MLKIFGILAFFTASALVVLAAIDDLDHISRMVRDVMVGNQADKLASAEITQPGPLPKGDRLCTWRGGVCWTTRPTITVTK